jgi:hypothetical protein
MVRSTPQARLTDPDLIEPSRRQRWPVLALQSSDCFLIGTDHPKAAREQWIGTPHPTQRALSAASLGLAKRQVEGCA